MNKALSTEQKVQLAHDCLDVENLHSLHAYFHCAGRNVEEVDNYWIRSDKVSWGHRFGKWLTWTGIKFGWAGSLERQGTYEFLCLSQAWPQTCGLDPRPLMEASMHTLSTDIIEIADDGKSARAFFYTPGMIYSTLNVSKKREGTWMWEHYGVEYMKDADGQWKIFSMQVCPDWVSPFDANNPAASSYAAAREGRRYNPRSVSTDGEAAGPKHGAGAYSQIPGGGGPKEPILDEEYTIHTEFGITVCPQDTVPYPEPYEHFDYEKSYRYPGRH